MLLWWLWWFGEYQAKEIVFRHHILELRTPNVLRKSLQERLNIGPEKFDCGIDDILRCGIKAEKCGQPSDFADCEGIIGEKSQKIAFD